MKAQLISTGKIYDAKYFKDMTQEEKIRSVTYVENFDDDCIFLDVEKDSSMPMAYYYDSEVIILPEEEKVKILFLYFENSILNSFLENQIKRSGFEVERINLTKNSGLIDFYKISKHHTIIFEKSNREIIEKLEGPFSAEDLITFYALAKSKIEVVK